MEKDQIGSFAGIVWRTLNDKGRLSFEELMHATHLSNDVIWMAIGWLAREGKIEFDGQNGISVYYIYHEHYY